MSEDDTPKYPVMPSELWMIWDGRRWVVAIDEIFGGDLFLVAATEADATEACEIHKARYDMLCVPVRVK